MSHGAGWRRPLVAIVLAQAGRLAGLQRPGVARQGREENAVDNKRADHRHGSREAVFHRVCDHLDEHRSSAGLLGAHLRAGTRVRQINVWRPIKGPVKRAPLALADAQSVAPEELVATDQIFPDRVGEIYQLAHGNGQRWYWVPEMEADEAVLIKSWDSIDDGRARFTPHGAFQLPEQDQSAPPRESIEVRTYAIFEKWES